MEESYLLFFCAVPVLGTIVSMHHTFL